METKFIEACQGEHGPNWGKFMVARFTPEEWARPSAVGGRSLLHSRGKNPDAVLVHDLETNEGAFFRPGGLASADLQKHRIWVCPLFEPFLAWLYLQDLRDLNALPSLVHLPDVPFDFAGYRRAGPTPKGERPKKTRRVA